MFQKSTADNVSCSEQYTETVRWAACRCGSRILPAGMNDMSCLLIIQRNNYKQRDLAWSADDFDCLPALHCVS